MRRSFLIASAGFIALLALAVGIWAPDMSAQQARSAAANALLGGATGTAKYTLRGVTIPIDGLMVQLISKTTGVRTTVYTNEQGNFEFPKLETGDYVLRIPRPMEFKRYSKDPIRIEGATKIGDIVMERITEGPFVPPTRDVLAQLSGAEWLANIEGTAEEKRLFTNSCTNSCHGGDRPFMQKFSPQDWVKIVDRMTNYSHRVLTSANESVPLELNANAKKIAAWLGRVRNLESEYPPIEPFSRPTGIATRAIVTEYELPYTAVHIHDVAGDARGNIWFNVNRSPYVGMLDPKTARVRTYRLPEKTFNPGLSEDEIHVDPYKDPPGIHPGQHGLFYDKVNDIIYSTGTWDRNIVSINPKTHEVKTVFTERTQNGNMALHPDGKSIWRTDEGLIKKYDLPGVFQTGRPSKTWKLNRVNNTYGNFISNDGRYFGGGSGSWIVWFDMKTEELREIPVATGGARGRGSFDNENNIWSGAQKLTKYDPRTGSIVQFTPPTPYYHSYSAKADKNGDIWSGQQQGGRIGRFNPKTGLWIEYVLPTPWSFDYMSHIDNTTSPPTFWYGDQHGYIVKVQPLE
jgi:streptogramin lyase